MTNGNNGGDRLDLLIDQIGILTELVTTGFSELKNGLSEIKVIAQAQQKEMERIASSIDKLAETVASQSETAIKQADTVAKQAQTVDRLALMLERVLVDRVQNN